MRLLFVHWFLLFALYGFWGYILDSAYSCLRRQKLTNNGLLALPIMPIHGFTAVISAFFTSIYVGNPVFVFLFAILISCVMRVVSVYLPEIAFGIILHDYQKFKFSLHGRVNFYASTIDAAVVTVLILFVHNPVSSQLAAAPLAVVLPVAVALCIAIGYDTFMVSRHLSRLNSLLSLMENAKMNIRATSVQAPLRRDGAKYHRLFHAFPAIGHKHHPEMLIKIKEQLIENGKQIDTPVSAPPDLDG
ncbi:MAG: putative ABC transporter permease [Defluviitaleaceae bacterium]|nr:putative ABC transporter permease [Defluviitaleaceae bacterium]